MAPRPACGERVPQAGEGPCHERHSSLTQGFLPSVALRVRGSRLRMTRKKMSFVQRFKVKGVFWRRILRWAVLNIPLWIEPVVIAWWSLFFLLWGPGRRGVMRNLTAIKPGSWVVANFFRTFCVFWNYAWTITDNVRFKELRTVPEWSFIGR